MEKSIDYRQERTDAAYQAALDAMAELNGGVQLPSFMGLTVIVTYQGMEPMQIDTRVASGLCSQNLIETLELETERLPAWLRRDYAKQKEQK